MLDTFSILEFLKGIYTLSFYLVCSNWRILKMWYGETDTCQRMVESFVSSLYFNRYIWRTWNTNHFQIILLVISFPNDCGYTAIMEESMSLQPWHPAVRSVSSLGREHALCIFVHIYLIEDPHFCYFLLLLLSDTVVGAVDQSTAALRRML